MLMIENAALVLVMMGILWIYSLWRQDSSVVDPWWSFGFLLVAGNSFRSGAQLPAQIALLATVVIWSLRLWGFLLWRGWGQPEDRRYQAFRKKYAEKYWWVSLFLVFGLQAALICLISWPLQTALSNPDPSSSSLKWWHLLGALLSTTGLIVEAVADAQLAAFRRRSDFSQRVLDSGLWRYSRHPNYFGESLVWWGFWLSSWGSAPCWSSIFSPLLMTYLLLRVSGVPMLESDLKTRKPEYADYISRTSSFVLWPPRS